MDALPVTEKTDLSFASGIPGKMHACGHDAHTAILLGTARMLKRAEEQGKLPCRVRLIFQANEEGEESGAAAMVNDGVMDDVDEIIALYYWPSALIREYIAVHAEKKHAVMLAAGWILVLAAVMIPLMLYYR